MPWTCGRLSACLFVRSSACLLACMRVLQRVRVCVCVRVGTYYVLVGTHYVLVGSYCVLVGSYYVLVGSYYVLAGTYYAEGVRL